MSKLERILVPVDFSDHSQKALRFAVQIAKATHAKLDLLHSHTPPLGTVTPYDYALPAAVLAELRAEAEKQLAETLAQAKAQDAEAESHLSDGHPTSAICDAAERLASDLIVMGTHGHSGLKHLLLGSVTESVIRRVTCPVISVPHTKSDTDRPIRTILVPVDFSVHAEHALDWAIRFAKVFDARIHLLHSYPVNVGSVSPYGPALPSEYTLALRQAAEEKISEWADKITAKDIAVETELSQIFPSEIITQVAEKVDADLIAMGTRGLTGLKHILLGSVAERTLRAAPCPVMTIRREDD